MSEMKGASSEAPVTSVIFEVEFRTDDLLTARHWAARLATLLFREDEVEAVTVSAKAEYDASVEKHLLPITERYLEDPAEGYR